MPTSAARAGVLRAAAFGVPFEVRVDDRRLLPAVRERLPPGWGAAHRPPVLVLSLVHEVSDTSFWTDRVAERTVAARRMSGSVVGLSVRLDGQEVARGLSHADALDVFESELQLCVARLAPQKGLDVLIEAASLLARHPRRPLVVIAGEGPLQARLASRIADSAAPVRLLGP